MVSREEDERGMEGLIATEMANWLCQMAEQIRNGTVIGLTVEWRGGSEIQATLIPKYAVNRLSVNLLDDE